jgi:hypothetical protein
VLPSQLYQYRGLELLRGNATSEDIQQKLCKGDRAIAVTMRMTRMMRMTMRKMRVGRGIEQYEAWKTYGITVACQRAVTKAMRIYF